MRRYQITSANAATAFEAIAKLVEDVRLMQEGPDPYEPIGGVAIIRNDNGTYTAAQAMVRGEG